MAFFLESPLITSKKANRFNDNNTLLNSGKNNHYTIFTRVYIHPILEPKDKFFLFLGKNFLEKLSFR